MKGKPKHCLLVVDDEPDLVHSVQDLLRFDYRVLGATRAAEGLKIMERESVQIVMSDQRMPEMTGVEFLGRLRQNYPSVVRLLFTAYADIKAVIDAINQGHVYRYITKPWEPQELQAVLRQAAEHYDLLEERRRLLDELKEKNRQLERANDELREANELKKGFIKVASHELRTPLTIVMGLSDLARKTPGLPDPLGHWLERIHVGSVRLNERVELMTKLLLTNSFDRPLRRKAVALADLVRRAADDVATFVQQRRQRLEVEAPADLGTVAVEEDKLRDCVFQLLINAVKFTPDGGVIRVSARRLADGGTEVSVADTGVGVDAASLPRLFDPFFTRFDVSRHSSGVYEFERRGLGLGLAVVKAFVEMHGGRVHAESELGKGTTIAIALPPESDRADTEIAGGI
ncbi:MAG: hybrid sensor histidine kinase/response regulator [Gemmataceae bacterium]|nr:hybrid sensor histidine kinase/response regulator [Gemmataceae bacterium]